MDRAADLDPEARELLETMDDADVPDLHDLPPREAREFFSDWRGEPTDVPDPATVTDRTVPGDDDGPAVPVRVYTPEGEGPFPVLVYLHGGGWVIGSLDTADGICRVLADEANCVVVSAGYRLAPEHPFPAGLEDAIAATEWVADHPEAVDGDGRLAVGGDSAGGNLAAAVALHARETGGPAIDHQMLVYPVVDPAGDWPSYKENGEGYYLERADIDYFRRHYWRSDLELANPYACPLAACSHADLPSATVVTCGFDPLRDEGAAYARVLRDAGVDVTHRNYDDVIHGFFSMLAPPVSIERAHEAVDAVAADLCATFED